MATFAYLVVRADANCAIKQTPAIPMPFSQPEIEHAATHMGVFRFAAVGWIYEEFCR
jgi:hypothetical protein